MPELFSQGVASYNYTKATNILNIPDTFTLIVSLSATLEAGVYEVGFAVQGVMPDTNDLSYVRFRIDGGAWSEFRKEAKSVDETFGLSYGFPTNRVSGPFLMEVEARKGTGGNQFDIFFADAFCRRVQ